MGSRNVVQPRFADHYARVPEDHGFVKRQKAKDHRPSAEAMVTSSMTSATLHNGHTLESFLHFQPVCFKTVAPERPILVIPHDLHEFKCGKMQQILLISSFRAN